MFIGGVGGEHFSSFSRNEKGFLPSFSSFLPLLPLLLFSPSFLSFSPLLFPSPSFLPSVPFIGSLFPHSSSSFEIWKWFRENFFGWFLSLSAFFALLLPSPPLNFLKNWKKIKIFSLRLWLLLHLHLYRHHLLFFGVLKQEV